MLTIQGIHYSNRHFYHFLTWLKLREKHSLRYQIAAKYIHASDKVMDICAGTGEFKRFLPSSTEYVAVEASDKFCRQMRRKKIKTLQKNLHEEELQKIEVEGCNVAVMIISLAQFRKTTVSKLLGFLKDHFERVVIVEDVGSRREENSFTQRMVNYLCNTEYFIPVSWYNAKEFCELMQEQGYRWEKQTERYFVGTYENRKN